MIHRTIIRIRAAFNKAIRPAFWTAVWTFVGVFGFGMVGFLESIQQWAGGSADFPDLSVLRGAAVAGAMSALVGFTGGAIRFVQAISGHGTLPDYGESD